MRGADDVSEGWCFELKLPENIANTTDQIRTLWLFLVRSVGHSTIDDSAAIAGAEILLLINRSNVACLISLRAWRFGEAPS
nr:hypothetical protein Itr_chr08CG08350 [Ipomoea trifida]